VKYVLQKGKIIATREMNYTKDIIMPADYEEVKNAAKINRADSKDSLQINFHFVNFSLKYFP
jgi:hypothetical protein